MESDQSTFHDFQNSGNRWSNYYRQNPERLSYGLLALLYIMILALFITVFSKFSSTGSCVTIGHRSYIGANGVNYEAQWGMQTSDTSRGVREAKQHFSKAVKFIGAGGGTASSSGNLQLVSKKEINDFNSKVSKLSSEMDQLQSTFKNKKCQDDWIQFENSCYYISKTKFDWTEARTMCQKKESDLLVINSAKEQLFIAGKTNPTSFKRFWLGLHDTDEEGLWKWVDETNYETSYKSWTKGEPNNHGDEEDCALLWTNGEWNDVPCSYENSYAVCEQKL